MNINLDAVRGFFRCYDRVAVAVHYLCNPTSMRTSGTSKGNSKLVLDANLSMRHFDMPAFLDACRKLESRHMIAITVKEMRGSRKRSDDARKLRITVSLNRPAIVLEIIDALETFSRVLDIPERPSEAA